MLRDMGWTISLAASNVLWTGAGPDNAASTAANWSPGLPMPGDNLVFGNSPRTDINFELEIRSADSLTFLATAPAYTIRLPHSSLKVNGAGISNSSGQTQTFEVGEQFYSAMQDSDGALTFNNAANSGNAVFTAHAGVAHREVPLSGLPFVLRSTAGLVAFNDTASAGSGSFRTTGGVGNGAGGGRVQFHGSATAAAASFTNEGGRLGDSFPAGVFVDGFGGQTEFFDSASAGTAHFTNNGEAGGMARQG